MIILDGSSEALTGVLGSGITSDQPEFTCSFADISAAALDEISGASSQNGEFNGTTPVDLVSAPSSTDERDVKYIFIHNLDSVTHTVTIKHGTRTIYKCNLAAGGSATYSSEHGWIVYDSTGAAGTGLSAHNTTHQNGGSDEINVDGLSGELADPQPPKTHASTHITGQSDEIDGDKLDIDWNPTNYTPTTSPTEADSVDNLTAHLAGIDSAIGTDVQNLADHEADTANPHATDIGNLGSGTLAELNAAITDATLDDSGDPRDPNAHATSHQSGGGDAIKLDDLASPDDNTDLNATASAHGLLPKLSGVSSQFLDGTGAWSTPAGGGSDLCSESEETEGLAIGYEGTSNPDYILIDDCATGGPRKIRTDFAMAQSGVGGRLSGSSNAWGAVTDVSNSSTLYYHHFIHNHILLRVGTDRNMWCPIYQSGYIPSIAGSSLTASKMYDIFAYWSVANSRVELEAVVWTNTTTRASALDTSRSLILTKNGDYTRRYLGSVYVDASQQFNDSVTNRHIWNMYNKVDRLLYKREHSATGTWSLAAAGAWAAANADTNNNVSAVTGLATEPIYISVWAYAEINATTNGTFAVGIGVDSSTVDSSKIQIRTRQDSVDADLLGANSNAIYDEVPSIGLHTYYWIEQSFTTTFTVYGDQTVTKCGINGRIRG